MTLVIGRIQMLVTGQTGSYDKTARSWSLSTGEMLRTFSGHARGVTSIALSAHDADLLVTCEKDGNARSWSLSTGEILRTFRGHAGHVSREMHDTITKQTMDHN